MAPERFLFFFFFGKPPPSQRSEANAFLVKVAGAADPSRVSFQRGPIITKASYFFFSFFLPMRVSDGGCVGCGGPNCSRLPPRARV
ncbi:hypothetical protein TRSC58_07712 [Trypanosoma rangeli SC58]|uniref:Uncharacterized protein n=1 Tax=Trypanosoma rangeli SC58 TaxID=429131 RepID=A0A061IRN7_TRYRA|nr:hypothetical protein TRSC58_07712 [Trypanosoma rangeli SC58]